MTFRLQEKLESYSYRDLLKFEFVFLLLFKGHFEAAWIQLRILIWIRTGFTDLTEYGSNPNPEHRVQD
jgi:hypothetical protein